MPVDQAEHQRAKTQIIIGGPEHHIESLTDICVIYPDPANTGQRIAHSLMTNRVGLGRTSSEAYCDLLLGVVQAIRYINERDHDAVLGKPAPVEIQDKYYTAHRLKAEIQDTVIERARALLLATEGNRPECSDIAAFNAVSVPLEDTGLVGELVGEFGIRVDGREVALV